MSSERAPASLVSAWQEQPTSGFRMVPSDVARRIRADKRGFRLSIWITLGVLVYLIVSLGSELFAEADPIKRVGVLLTVLALVFFVGQIAVHMRRVKAARFDVDRTTAPSIASARAYLNTRREFHSGLWLWSRVIALFPGVPIVFYQAARIDPDQIWMKYFPLLWVLFLAFAVFVVQRRVRQRYERQLRELDDIERYSPLERYVAAHEQWK